jgi:exodeoxyribonuclease III
MNILSFNVNGIRSAYKKGFLNWFEKVNADMICLQEIKAQIEQMPEELSSQSGYHLYINQAVKKGYSGVAVFTKVKPLGINKELGLERFDDEGRMLELTFSDFILIAIYMPHGGRMKENLSYKLEAYRKLFDHISKINNKNIIIAGDFNIAHEEIDLARPKGNKNNIMFTPGERKNIDSLLNHGFIDSFRKFDKRGGNYTWWPYMANARERNIGWRIDYIFISLSLDKKIKNAFILPDVKGSDHCPIGIEM